MLRKIAIAFAVLLLGLLLLAVRLDLPASELDVTYGTPSSKFALLADGTRMHYWDRGDARKPVLVLLHGSYDCANTWELWAPLLERDFRLIVPDLPAHGLTGKTKPEDYSIDGMVAAVHGLLAKLGIARASFAGNSMGGNTAWMYAVRHPEQVERLVLIDSSGYPGLRGVGPTSRNAVTQLLYRYGNPVLLVGRGFRAAVADPAVITDERIERSTAFLRREGSREAHAKRATQRRVDEQALARLRESRVPTLILWGDQDALIPVAHAARFDADIPDSRAIIYKGIGHMPQLEHPRQSAADARAFLVAGTAPTAL